MQSEKRKLLEMMVSVNKDIKQVSSDRRLTSMLDNNDPVKQFIFELLKKRDFTLFNTMIKLLEEYIKILKQKDHYDNANAKQIYSAEVRINEPQGYQARRNAVAKYINEISTDQECEALTKLNELRAAAIAAKKFAGANKVITGVVGSNNEKTIGG